MEEGLSTIQAGGVIPPRRSRKTTDSHGVSLTMELWRKIDEIAELEDVSRSHAVEHLVEKGMKVYEAQARKLKK